MPAAARAAGPARDRARDARQVEPGADLRGVAEADRGRAAVDLLRGAAHGERHAGRAPHRGPGLQGPLPPVQDHAGVPRHPQGRLGLPRAAGGGRRREGTRPVRQEGHRGLRRRRVQRSGAGSRCCGTSTRSPRSPPGWGTGSTCPPPTAPWTRSTWSPSGGRSRRSTTRACWSGTSGSARTARGAARRCPTTRWASRTSTGTSPTPRSPSGSRHAVPEGANPHLTGADLLVWTTTPWTLVSNTAIAVHPEVEYVIARERRRRRQGRGRRGAVAAGARRRLACARHAAVAASCSARSTRLRSAS